MRRRYDADADDDDDDGSNLCITQPSALSGINTSRRAGSNCSRATYFSGPIQFSCGNFTAKQTIRRPLSNGRRYCGIPSFKMHRMSPGLITSPTATSTTVVVSYNDTMEAYNLVSSCLLLLDNKNWYNQLAQFKLLDFSVVSFLPGIMSRQSSSTDNSHSFIFSSFLHLHSEVIFFSHRPFPFSISMVSSKNNHKHMDLFKRLQNISLLLGNKKPYTPQKPALIPSNVVFPGICPNWSFNAPKKIPLNKNLL